MMNTGDYDSDIRIKKKHSPWRPLFLLFLVNHAHLVVLVHLDDLCLQLALSHQFSPENKPSMQHTLCNKYKIFQCDMTLVSPLTCGPTTPGGPGGPFFPWKPWRKKTIESSDLHLRELQWVCTAIFLSAVMTVFSLDSVEYFNIICCECALMVKNIT